MRIDKEEHRAILLELLDQAQFRGSSRKVVYELGEAIEKAEVASGPKHAEAGDE